MEVTNNEIERILQRLSLRLDYSNTIETGSYYNRAYGIIERDMSANGTPSDERAFHLCRTGGVPEAKYKHEEVYQERKEVPVRGLVSWMNNRKGFGKRYF